jgi:hypothetical protein
MAHRRGLGAVHSRRPKRRPRQSAETGLRQYIGTGRYRQITLAQRALAIREKALGPEHPETSPRSTIWAELYRASSAYAKAEPL